MSEKTVFRIVSNDSNEFVGSFSRAYHDEYDFSSAYKARHANCHGMFLDEEKYRIAKYRVIYELIEDNCPIEDSEYVSLTSPILGMKKQNKKNEQVRSKQGGEVVGNTHDSTEQSK